jgi:hypothetical protein
MTEVFGNPPVSTITGSRSRETRRRALPDRRVAALLGRRNRSLAAERNSTTSQFLTRRACRRTTIEHPQCSPAPISSLSRKCLSMARHRDPPLSECDPSDTKLINAHVNNELGTIQPVERSAVSPKMPASPSIQTASGGRKVPSMSGDPRHLRHQRHKIYAPKAPARCSSERTQLAADVQELTKADFCAGTKTSRGAAVLGAAHLIVINMLRRAARPRSSAGSPRNGIPFALPTSAQCSGQPPSVTTHPSSSLLTDR